MDRERLIKTLRRDEGYRQAPYRDSRGNLTIGIGRNLGSVGISAEEAHQMLSNDIDRCATDAACLFGEDWQESFTDVQQEVVINLIFNLGLGTFREFRKAIAAFKAGDMDTAADEILDSRAARQTGERYHRLAQALRTNSGDAFDV